MEALARHLTVAAGPLLVNSERLCIFDPSQHNEMALPNDLDAAIREANRLGEEIKKGREAFVLIAEKRFSVLPKNSF
jgi:ribosomal 50S subunit-associated protein YjgA (DUF615 family)